MNDLSLHLAPNAPWPWLVLASLAFLALGIWAYRFGVPPMPPLVRRLLSALRVLVLVALAWLLAQPVLERARAGRPAKLVVLVDRSASMDLPAGTSGTRRADLAARAVDEVRSAWRGRADVRVLGFAGGLVSDSAGAGERSGTALGDALGALPGVTGADGLDAVVVVSDGIVNAGADPVQAAQTLGVPVHAVFAGGSARADRAVTEVEAPARARVGEPTPVRVHVTSSEPRGTPIPVRLLDGGRELARRSVSSPGPGLEAVAEFSVPPPRPGLAVWTAAVDSLRGQITAANDARQVALEVAPGRLGVLLVSAGLNWDVAFVRRALAGDSSLALDTRTREREGWRALESRRAGAAPGAEDLRTKSVVVLDGLAPAEVSPAFDAALAEFVRRGGGLMVLGGGAPGLLRLRSGRLGAALALAGEAQAVPRLANPQPEPAAAELIAWDEDAARGEAAWRGAAPLSDPAPIAVSAGDRVLITAAGSRLPLLFVRRIGRGQVMLLNGGGVWRWALSATDPLAPERSRRLWRTLARWLAEPVQGEPLRVRPERWVSASGERVRLFASLQDSAFRPVGGARIEGEARDARGRRVPLAFAAGSTGSYAAALDGLAPGSWEVSIRAVRGGREAGRATTEFAVDRWSLESARIEPDSATLAAVARATGGRMTDAGAAGGWARALQARSLARVPTRSLRLWESPWVFALAVAALSVEWIWRRRRGLP